MALATIQNQAPILCFFRVFRVGGGLPFAKRVPFAHTRFWPPIYLSSRQRLRLPARVQPRTRMSTLTVASHRTAGKACLGYFIDWKDFHWCSFLPGEHRPAPSVSEYGSRFLSLSCILCGQQTRASNFFRCIRSFFSTKHACWRATDKTRGHSVARYAFYRR